MKYLERILAFILPSYGRRETRTVRYAFPALLISVSLLGLASVSSSLPSTVRIEASKTNVSAGDEFALKVYVDASQPVNAIDLSVRLPQDMISYVGVDKGQSVITLWTKEPYYENGAVHLIGGTFRQGFVGEHFIATINVRAKASGIAHFSANSVTLLAGDGSGTMVPYTDSVGDAPNVAIGTVAAKALSLKANTSVTIVTDLDGDGKVTLADVSRFMVAWATGNSVLDFNGDGKMTFADFGIILSDSFFKH